MSFLKLTDQHQRSLNLVVMGIIAVALMYMGVISTSVSPVAALCGFLVLALGLIIQMRHRNRAKITDQPEARTFVKTAMEASPDSVILINEYGSILHINTRTEHQFGHPLADTIGRNLLDLLFPEERVEPSIFALRNCFSSGQIDALPRQSIQLIARKRTGQNVPVSISISPYETEKNKEFVVYLRDIGQQLAVETELMQSRDRALEGEQAKSRFIAVMSHEMRTPLNGLLGTLDLLSRTSLSAKQSQYLLIAQKSGQLLLEHVNDVLDISKIESGKSSVEQRVFNPLDIVNEVYEGQLSVSQARSNKLSVSNMSGNLGTVIGDPGCVRQILLNLVSNANKFTSGGSIQIEVEDLADSSGTIEFRVADTGIGIAPESLQTIFADFVTLDPKFDRQAEGTGLGLSIAKRLTQALRGEIGVESDQGEGSLFWFRIPFGQRMEEGNSSPQDTTLPPADEQTTGHAPLRVLVVEDNKTNRFVVREMLEADGHIVTEAIDGEAGVAAAQKGEFDAILMDISMPKLDGISATEQIRKSTVSFPKLPIIALTAHALPLDIEKFQAAGMNDYLTKPITQKQLRSVLAKTTDIVPIDPIEEPRAGSQPPQKDSVDQEIMHQLLDIIGITRTEELLKKYLKEAKTTVAELLLTTQPSNIHTVIPKIHCLAGSSSTFGARLLQEKLCHLEKMGRAGEYDGFVQGLPALSEILEKTERALNESLLDRPH